ncbi:DNA ligase D [Virgibacillus ainsalahensis]
MDIMKPIASSQTPLEDEWLYEVKFDGFRCVLDWGPEHIRLISKNNKDLTGNFPEIVDTCRKHQMNVSDLLPLKLDGELVVLNNPYQANFSLIQKRGRLKNKDTIKKAAGARPAHFLAFDILRLQGNAYHKKSYFERKSIMEEVVQKTGLNYIGAYENLDELKKIIFKHKGEGLIAKRKKSTYQSGKNHHDWFKVKNWRTIHGFLTHYDTKNDYFTVCVYENESIKEIGKCKHGLDTEAFRTLKDLFSKNGERVEDGYVLPPAICASIHTLDLYKNELREPEFHSLLPDASPADCTMKRLQLDMAMLPDSVNLTNTDKVFWPADTLTKGDLLRYIREIGPYMLPFLKERALTVIRSPDGVRNEHFFQKHLPDYAPDFIDSVEPGDERLIICNELDALVWFANHGAIEYHVPFQRVDEKYPVEIVFDLDPPDGDHFHMAIQAALRIKPLLDELELVSFVKTSGNKGLQIHIPIPKGSMTYDETAIFTQAIAWTVENAYPDMLTTERMKNKRKGRLYIDYVQHGKDKTLIAPYSPRKTEAATIATPLFWEEVDDGLRPDSFTIENVVQRVQEIGCPFQDYFNAGEQQKLDKVLEMVKE